MIWIYRSIAPIKNRNRWMRREELTIDLSIHLMLSLSSSLYCFVRNKYCIIVNYYTAHLNCKWGRRRWWWRRRLHAQCTHHITHIWFISMCDTCWAWIDSIVLFWISFLAFSSSSSSHFQKSLVCSLSVILWVSPHQCYCWYIATVCRPSDTTNGNTAISTTVSVFFSSSSSMLFHIFLKRFD